MTEIPEHLLQRSRERRAAMGGGDGDSGDAGASPAQEGSSSAPAKAAAPAAASLPAHPAPAEEPPKPPNPLVEAYTRRRKVPYWAMPVLAALPVWAYVFAGTLEPPPQETPETIGSSLYGTQCASCHGGTGGGGIGPAFTDGAVFETWPAFEDHIEWVALGGAGYAAAHDTDTYGATDKPINGAGMPAFGEALTEAELVYITLHERHLAGDNPDDEDHARLAALAELMFEGHDMPLEDALAELEEMIASGAINLEDYAEE